MTLTVPTSDFKTEAEPSPAISFKSWRPATQGRVYSLPLENEEADSLLNAINSLSKDGFNLAARCLSNTDPSKSFVYIFDDEITEEWLVKLPALNELRKLHLRNPGIPVIAKSEIEAYNMRRSVETHEQMVKKLQNQLNNAQRHNSMKLHSWVNFLISREQKKITTEITNRNYTNILRHLFSRKARNSLNPCGGSETQSDNRPYMEDITLVTAIEIQNACGSIHLPLYAVFDGHEGTECAEFLEEKLPVYLQDKFVNLFDLSQEEREIDIYNTLKTACVALGREFRIANPGIRAGSTATYALVIDDALWVANVGDSRAIVSVEGMPLALSEDADLSFPHYQEGVWKRGELISNDGYCLRVNSVGMARAVGHEAAGINPRATITCVPLPQFEGKACNLVMATDGLWDFASTTEAADARFHFKKASREIGDASCASDAMALIPPTEVARLLVDQTLQLGLHYNELALCQDNISVLAINLSNPI